MEKTTEPVKLFIGEQRVKNWLNCKNKDLISIDSDSIDHICSEFNLQELERDECLKVLKHYKRILKKNCTIRITVPDYFLVSDKYIKSKMRIEEVNKILHPSKQLFDFLSIQKLMTMAGFYAVKRLDIDRHPPMDDSKFYYNGENITLTIEAYG